MKTMKTSSNLSPTSFFCLLSDGTHLIFDLAGWPPSRAAAHISTQYRRYCVLFPMQYMCISRVLILENGQGGGGYVWPTNSNHDVPGQNQQAAAAASVISNPTRPACARALLHTYNHILFCCPDASMHTRPPQPQPPQQTLRSKTMDVCMRMQRRYQIRYSWGVKKNSTAKQNQFPKACHL